MFFIFLLPVIVTGQVVTDTSARKSKDTIPGKDSISIIDTPLKKKVRTPTIIDTTPVLPKKDSTAIPDTFSIKEIEDSIIHESNKDSLMKEDKFYGDLFNDNRGAGGTEILFYAIIVLLVLFALLNRLFPKYFSDLYRLFFRTTLHQSQIREQMLQSPLPSLLLNFFFVITAGMYLNFLFQHYQVRPVDNFWLLFMYCSLGLGAIYFIKYLSLKFSGWIFNARTAADSYIFIVFVVNKMIGVFLLPVIIILAFTQGRIYDMGIGFSYFVIAAFFIYRFILAYSSIRNQVRVSPFHFILFVIVFEILPLFIIYKLLLVILERTA
jgi:hypothetical protein